MSASLDPAQLIERFKDKNHPATYILGGYATRVTFHSQQIRAFNLIYALFKTKKLKAGSEVCVIGGGLAGLTVAAAAQLKGCIVTVYEEKDYLLGLQKGSQNRYVHPNIYDWPEEGCNINATDLPCLNWSSGTAEEILKQIQKEWDTDFSTVTTHVKHQVNSITRVSNKPRISVSDPFVFKPFNCAIVATGFGIEKPLGTYPARSYWKSDELHQQYSATTPTTSFLVSGCGDGGLIDTLRLSLQDFSHEDFIQNFLNDSSMGDIKTEILEIEENAFDDQENASAILWDGYEGLDFPPELLEKIKKSFRTDTKVVLNGKIPTPMTLQSSLINRIGVYLLLRLRKVSYKYAKLGAVSIDGSKCKATLLKESGEAVIEEYDDVILRHGPEAVINQLVAKDLSLVDKSKKDPTAIRSWPDDFYPTKSIPTPALSPMEIANEKKSELSVLIEKHAKINSIHVSDQSGNPIYVVSIHGTTIPAEVSDINRFNGHPVYYTHDSGFEFAMGPIKTGPGILAGGAAIYNADSGNLERSGTLGCFVELSNGLIGMLSSYHVLGMNGKEGDKIALKSRTGTKTSNIGKLFGFTKLRTLLDDKQYMDDTRSNSIDAAVALLDSDVPFFPGMMNNKVRYEVKGTARAMIGDSVYKIGAGTGLTRGTVTQVDSIMFLQADGKRYRFDNCIMIKAEAPHVFSGKGDSGAIVLNSEGKACGLVFASDSNTTAVCPIDEIFKQLNCKLFIPKPPEGIQP